MAMNWTTRWIKFKEKAEPIAPLIAIVGAFAVFAGLYYVLSDIRGAEQERQKQCYKDLTLIVERSPRDKIDWIEKTIKAEKNILGGVSYCRVLELVRESGRSETGDSK